MSFYVTERERARVVKIVHDFDKDHKYAKWRKTRKIKTNILNFYEYGKLDK